MSAKLRTLTCLVVLAPFACLGPVVMAQTWVDRPWVVECTDPPECSPADEIYRQHLEAAANWLGGLGFKSPVLAPASGQFGKFYVEVSDQHTEDKEYVGVYYKVARKLYLNSEYFFTLGDPGQDFDDPEYQVELSKPFTPVHELFHAIQANDQPGRLPDWIGEGTADAVRKAYMQRFEPESEAEPRLDRSYADSLHQPGSKTAGYATWRFWYDVGNQLGSPDGIQYLQDVLTQDLSQNEGLDGVDQALPGGLVTQLPRFFAGLSLAGFEPERHDISGSDLPIVKRFDLGIEPVAGKGAAVTVSADRQEDVTVNFAIEFDNPDLHLIVDGDVYGQSNATFSMAAGSEKTFDVVIANVAQTASASQPQNAVLRVTVTGSAGCYVFVEYTGETEGSEHGNVAYYNVFTHGEGVEAGMAAGTGVDSGMHDQLQGLTGMMGSFAEMAEQMGHEVDEDVMERLRSQSGEESAAVRETQEWEQELRHSGTDTFGLTLQANPATQSSQPSMLEGLAGLLGAGFNLGASGQHTALEGPGLTGTISFEPSLVYATVGLRDSSLEAVKFSWEPGEPGYANVTLRKPGEAPAIHGSVEAELYAEKPYDGRRPKIYLIATFAALEGFQSCMN